MTSAGSAATEKRANSSGLANATLIFTGICFLLGCLTVAGAVPVLIMLIGLILAVTSGDIKNAVYTTRISQALFGVAGAVGAVFFMINGWNWGDQGFLAICLLSTAVLLEFLWLTPIRRNLPAWRQSIDRMKTQPGRPQSGRIIGRDAMTTYSVADELIKWSKLREDGLVTDQQFEDARAKLLADG